MEAYPGQKLGGGLEGTTAFPMSADNRTKVKAFLAEEGVKLVSYGVTGANDEKGWRQLFDFAKDMGIEIIQIEAGKDAKTLDLVNKLAQEYGIKVAMHNHTQPGGFPDAVAQQLKGHPFIGSGADIGHWAAAGVVPLDGVKKLAGRFFTMHMVDMSKIGRGGEIVPFGQGATNWGKSSTNSNARISTVRSPANTNACRRRWKRKLASASSGITPISASDADARLNGFAGFAEAPKVGCGRAQAKDPLFAACCGGSSPTTLRLGVPRPHYGNAFSRTS